MEELKPCPFCGGEASLIVGDGVRVICKKCNCQTPSLIDRDYYLTGDGSAVSRVIEKWNRRVKDDETGN